MASNLLTDNPKTSSLAKIGRGRKKSNQPSSSKTKLVEDFARRRPITRSQTWVQNNPPLSGQYPIYDDLLDQIIKHPALIETAQHLVPLYHAFLGESLSQFEVEAYCLACKRARDNPQLMANFRLFNTAYNEVRSIPEERVTHAMDSPAANIVLDEIKTERPNFMKRKSTAEVGLLDMFSEYRDAVTSGLKSEPGSSANKIKAGWYGRTALHDACGNDEVKIADALLTLKGIVVDALDDDGNTALHYAASFGFEKCVKLLLRRGADVKLKSFFGKTPFDLAMLGNHTNVVDVMKKLRGKEVDAMMKLREKEVVDIKIKREKEVDIKIKRENEV